MMKRSKASLSLHKGKRAFKAREQPGCGSEAPSEDEEPLSAAQLKELERRIKDSEDPVRYMLVSEFTRRFILYYNVSEDVYAMNDPSGGTLFKRRKAAEGVRKLLGDRISIVKYNTKGGKLKRLSPHRGRW